MYFVAVIAIGYWSGKRENKQDFIIASRKVGVLRSSASMFAILGGEILIAQAAISYVYGIAAMWVWIGVALGAVCLGLAVGKIKPAADKNEHLTLSEYFHHKWGKRSSFIAAIIIFVGIFALLSMQFMAVGSLVAPLFNWSYSLVVIITGGVVLIYLLLGGYKAVINTDFVQAALMIVIVIILAAVVPLGSFSASDFNLFSLSAGIIVSFLFLGICTMFVAADLWQRIYSARDVKTARKSLWLTAALFLIFGFAITIIGISAGNNFPNADPNNAFYLGMSSLIPVSLLGIALVLVLAAVMSTIDTEVFVLASSVAKDFIGRRKKLNEDEIMKIIRVSMIVLTVLSVVFAILVRDIMGVLFTLLSLTLSLSPAIIASLFWKLKSKAVLVSLIAGVLAFLVLFAIGQLTAENAVVTFPAALIFLIIGQIFFKKDKETIK